MTWNYEKHIYETVDWFVREALPDPVPGWKDLSFRIEEMGRTEDRGFWWRASVDIPTSVEGMDCWL